MHPTGLISRALGDQEPWPEHASDGVCCVTGATTQTIARSELFGPSFVDQPLLAAPNSDRVGVDAYRALTHKWERMSSWICDASQFRRLKRIEIREAVIGAIYPAGAWSGYATTSYKKHGSLRAPVNVGGRARWLFENVVVDCSDAARVAEWWRVLRAAQDKGVGRTSMQTLSAPCGVLSKIGLGTWMNFRAWAMTRRGSPLYGFLVYLLPSKDELKQAAEGGSDEKQD